MKKTVAVGLALMLAATSLTACGGRYWIDPKQPPLSAERIAEIVAAPDRSAADRTTDQRRKPDRMLAFLAVAPGMSALDISAAGGYTTELVARAVGPAGTVYGQSAPPRENAPRPAQAEGNANPTAAGSATTAAPPPVRRPSPESLAMRAEAMKTAGAKAAPIVPVVRPFDDPVPPDVADAKLDLVTLIYNYHDFGFMGVDRAAMNRAVFKALKRGGTYAIADHAGRPGTGITESGTLHRIEEAFLVKEVEAAGFKLAGSADFLRNPDDPRDRNTPQPGQTKDGFLVKFVKP